MTMQDAPRTRTRSYSYALEALDTGAALRMSGLEYMRALAAGEIGAPPSMITTLGFSNPLDLEDGKAAFEADAADFLLNPMGAVHGGFAATLLDTVMGAAVHTSLAPGLGFTTSDLSVKYTRAILPGTGRLRAEATIVHRGRQMATAQGTVIGLADGKLYAHGSTTCLIFPLTSVKG